MRSLVAARVAVLRCGKVIAMKKVLPLLFALLAAACGSEDAPVYGSPAPQDGAVATDVGHEPDVGVDAPQAVCEPGRQLACGCPDGSAGAQRCLDDGSAWGPCSCPDAGALDGGSDAPEDGAPDALADADVYTPPIDCTMMVGYLEEDCYACITQQSVQEACDSPCCVTCANARDYLKMACVPESHDAGVCEALCMQYYGQDCEDWLTFVACAQTHCFSECKWSLGL